MITRSISLNDKLLMNDDDCFVKVLIAAVERIPVTTRLHRNSLESVQAFSMNSLEHFMKTSPSASLLFAILQR